MAVSAFKDGDYENDTPNRPAPLGPPPCIVSPLKYEASGPFPLGEFCKALYRYALKAPGNTLM